jgi:hypothetical protein
MKSGFTENQDANSKSFGHAEMAFENTIVIQSFN